MNPLQKLEKIENDIRRVVEIMECLVCGISEMHDKLEVIKAKYAPEPRG